MSEVETEVEAGEQTSLWPDLDEANPKHVSLLKAAKKFAKSKAERDELLSTAKEKQDADMAKVIAMMHEVGLQKFKHEGVSVELITTKEKAQVKLKDDDEEEADDE